MSDPTNTEIAAALDELGDLTELDGAAIYRTNAYRNAAKAVRDSPVSVLGLARQGRATEVPGVGAIIQEKIIALADEGAIPATVKLRAKFPPGRDRDDPPARPGAQAGPPAVRGAGDRLARRPARRRRGTAHPLAQGVRPQGRGGHPRQPSISARGARAGRRRRAPGARRPRPRAGGRRPADRGAARASGRRARGAGRLGPADDRHGQGPRRDRHRHRPARARAGRRRARPDRVRPPPRPRPASACAPTRASGSTCGSSRPTSSATCSST